MPDSDLLGLDPPEKGETYQAYKVRVGETALGCDRLFHFMLAELCSEELDDKEVEQRMDRAVEDINTVVYALVRPGD
jgi:hypothetical protein